MLTLPLGQTPSLDPMTGELVALPDIQTGDHEEPEPHPSAALENVGLRSYIHHMLSIPWDAVNGWGVPSIQPYGPLQLDPSTTVLHYAQTLFEGMKAYRDDNGKVTLFRPDMNMKRMNNSAKRIALPNFDGDALLDLIKELVRLDKHWIPKETGHSLYIRPTLIGTQKFIGVAPPTEALLFVICSPVGPYYPNGFKPIALYGTTEYIRAAPGGYELVTPPLDGMILPGVTRDSVLTLARGHAAGIKRLPNLPENLTVSERPITMSEVKEASKTNKLVELFGAGTAAVISPVDRIGYLNEDIHIPTGEDGMGLISRPIWTELVGIQTGKTPSEWSVVVTE
ncbi:branched-chain-amino-acid transaminase bat2 [Marasmius crinis-equi]|uniref:Branched-chain-amino-acid transaminase bat2 n=1 Tax=Marasmius crinis-equi TaxID=585013 RepID=A0ABR3FIL5_9AGAR